jgi:hypothetical protein
MRGCSPARPHHGSATAAHVEKRFSPPKPPVSADDFQAGLVRALTKIAGVINRIDALSLTRIGQDDDQNSTKMSS